MNERIRYQNGILVVDAHLRGPTGKADILLGVDTGSAFTVVSPMVLKAVGYSLADWPRRIRFISTTGVSSAPVVTLVELEAFGQRRARLTAIAHAVPLSAPVVGLLGLNFLRAFNFCLQFRDGVLTLE